MAATMTPAALLVLYLSSLRSNGLHPPADRAASASKQNAVGGGDLQPVISSGMLLAMYMTAMDIKKTNMRTEPAAGKVSPHQELPTAVDVNPVEDQPVYKPSSSGQVASAPVKGHMAPSSGRKYYGCCSQLALHSTGSLARSVQKAILGTYQYVGMSVDHLPIYNHTTAHFTLFYNHVTKVESFSLWWSRGVGLMVPLPFKF